MTTRDQLIRDITAEATEWRRELHQNPQTMYEEEFASAFICRKLTEWGIPFERGIAKTGVAATIEGQRNHSGRSIAFRADIDALDIEEQSGQPWSSRTPGKMHGCGHDGHTATLLALAHYLQQTRNFDGTVQLIFQPAEEGGRGAFRMLEEGLLERFPFDEIYGYHNWPLLPRGSCGISAGPMLAAVDEFEIRLTGIGGHAAMPHYTRDAVPAAAHLVVALQTLVSRETDPLAAAVITVANLNAGSGALNVITGRATLTGTVRTFLPKVRDHIERRMQEMVDGIAATHQLTAELKYRRMMDATINHPESTGYAREAAAAVMGADKVNEFQPIMGGEDFGGFLLERPGAFMAIGQAEPDSASPHNHMVHSPRYDFNDAILPIATTYFAELAERRLPID
jgi:hippurate hydrolase